MNIRVFSVRWCVKTSVVREAIWLGVAYDFFGGTIALLGAPSDARLASITEKEWELNSPKDLGYSCDIKTGKPTVNGKHLMIVTSDDRHQLASSAPQACRFWPIPEGKSGQNLKKKVEKLLHCCTRDGIMIIITGFRNWIIRIACSIDMAESHLLKIYSHKTILKPIKCVLRGRKIGGCLICVCT